MTLTRLHGSVYQELDNGDILNFYRVKLANNTFEDIELSFQLSEGLGELRGPANLILPSYGSAETIINVLMPKAEMNSKKKLVTLEIMGTGGQELAQQDLVFIGPFLK
jgi:hypothetical protein